MSRVNPGGHCVSARTASAAANISSGTGVSAGKSSASQSHPSIRYQLWAVIFPWAIQNRHSRVKSTTSESCSKVSGGVWNWARLVAR